MAAAGLDSVVGHRPQAMDGGCLGQSAADTYSASHDRACPSGSPGSAHPAARGAVGRGRGGPRRHSDHGRRAARPRRRARRRRCCGACRRRCWCMRRRRCAGSGCGRCPASICWSCSPSCCRPAPPRRPRAAWRWRWTSRRRAPGRPPPRRCCPTSPQALLARLAAGRDLPVNREAAALARADGPGRAGAGRSPCMAALAGQTAPAGGEPLRVWRRLPEWEEVAPLPPPASPPGRRPPRRGRGWPPCSGRAPSSGPASPTMPRPPPPPSPRAKRRGDPHVVLAEAGTGTGKTLGYIAPASLWAERNKGAGVDFHLHPPFAAPGRGRTGPAAPRPGGAAPPRGGAQGARELSVPAQFRRRGERRAPSPRRPRPCRSAWWRAGRSPTSGRRHPGRRPAGLVLRAVRHRAGRRARRPARRVHPRRLPALAALLRRAHASAAPAAPNWWWPTMPW